MRLTSCDTEMVEHLARFAAPGVDGLVFIGPRGGTLARGNFHPGWATARTKADLPEGSRFHDLRHTHMTTAAQSGASTKELMRRLGQSSPAAALRYQHATDSRDAEIADEWGRGSLGPASVPSSAPPDAGSWAGHLGRDSAPATGRG